MVFGWIQVGGVGRAKPTPQNHGYHLPVVAALSGVGTSAARSERCQLPDGNRRGEWGGGGSGL